MPGPKRTDRPLIEELPRLLEERGRTMHSLAREARINPSHLSKVLRQAHYKTPSAALAEKVARALDLPPEYFAEYREAVLISRLKRDPRYRDELFDELAPEERGRPPGRSAA